MLDLKSEMRETKLRRFIVKNYKFIPALLKIKQADFSACKDDLSKAPSVERWEKLIEKMKGDGTPFSVKDLAVTAEDLKNLGYEGKALGDIIKKLFDASVLNPLLNNKTKLLRMAEQGI